VAAIRSGPALQVCLWAVLSSPIDQDCLLPTTWRLVSAVNAACPTAWPLLSVQEFVTGSRDAALACDWLLSVIDPADELVSAERRQAFPKRKDVRI
jgi:hypothetical protein